MTNSNRLCVIVCLLEAVVLVVAQTTNSSILVEEPAGLLLPINSTSDAVFTCTVVNGATIEWQIDARGETGLVFESSVDRQDLNGYGIFKMDTGLANISQVLVRRELDNNNTKLTCFGVNGSVLDESTSAHLVLYGPPPPPSDIIVSVSGALTLLVSWSPPYNPFIEVPFTYTLIINSTTILTDIPSNTTTYLYNTDDGGSCTNISFTLQSVNEAGSGDLSDTVTKQIPQVPSVPVNITVATDYNQTEDLSLALLSFKSPSVCPQYPVSSYIVSIMDITDSDNITTTTSTVSSDGSGNPLLVELTVDDGTIEPDRIYRGNVAAVNDVGASDSSREIEFRTTDVVSVYGSLVVSVDGILDISCTFIRGTIARGCRVIVKTTPTNDIILNDTIPRNHSNRIARKQFTISNFNSERMVPTNSAHQLTITAYDYEYDGTVGSIPVEGTILIQPTTRPTAPSVSVTTQTDSKLVTMTSGVNRESSSVMITSQDPTPTVVRSSSTSIIGSTTLFITVSVVVGLVILALLIVIMLIVIQRYYRIRRKRHSSGDELNVVDKENSDFYQVIDTNHYQKPNNNSVFKSSGSLSPAPSTNSVNKLRTTPTPASSVVEVVGSRGNGDVVVMIDPVQPYGITTLRLSTPVKQPLESMYQSVPETNHKAPVTQQNSTAPLIPSTSFSSDSTESPPPMPPIHQLPQSSSASISPEPFYHTLEQNATRTTQYRESNSTITSATTPIPATSSPAPPIPPPPTESLYDQVTERPSTATSYPSSTRAVPSPLQGTASASNTPTPKKDHIYHTLEENGPRNTALLASDQDDHDFFTISQSTCNSQQSGILDSQCTLSTVCSVRDNGNDVVFDDEVDGIGGLPVRQYPPSHYNVPRPSYQRQYTMDQAKSKSRSLPMGARMGLRERSNSVPDNHVIGIEPYNTLERKIHGSTHTLKRTLV